MSGGASGEAFGLCPSFSRQGGEAKAPKIAKNFDTKKSTEFAQAFFKDAEAKAKKDAAKKISNKITIQEV